MTNMNYSKLRVYYEGDGISLTSTTARQGMLKTATITLPKKVVNYIKTNGIDSLKVRYSGDRIIIYSDFNDLMDKDINGSSMEYISSIVGYEWLDENNSILSTTFPMSSTSVSTPSKEKSLNLVPKVLFCLIAAILTIAAIVLSIKWYYNYVANWWLIFKILWFMYIAGCMICLVGFLGSLFGIIKKQKK